MSKLSKKAYDKGEGGQFCVDVIWTTPILKYCIYA